ncbi:hypothetical protein Syun_010140 [Stephania yunnanensis]|uniref:Uncharacterized protein n=1 Tax=Stephania yunnanensis TaxID=152371 RepID=A0AAP0KFX0_9MAGN
MASEEPEQKRMQSPRPVPRRESPWGRPEGDTRSPKRTDATTEQKMSSMLVLRGIPSKLFRVLSSSSGNACFLSPGKNRLSHSSILTLIRLRGRRRDSIRFHKFNGKLHSLSVL